jgi:NADH dehydrogenase FAD-containing subunit
MSEVKWQASGLRVHQASDVTRDHLQLEADVVIVGSGAGGAVSAYELAKRTSPRISPTAWTPSIRIMAVRVTATAICWCFKGPVWEAPR